MPRYAVTPVLADTIKTVRLQNHVASKAVAEHIGKSQSYMSKLEKGDIKTIEESELTAIFRFAFGDDKGFQDFLNSSLKKILDTLEMRFTDEEITEQIWFDNYDTVFRTIPIPQDVVDNIRERIDENQITIENLCDQINSNIDLPPEINEGNKYPVNEWQAHVVDHKIEFRFIKLKIELEKIKKILTGEITSTNYVTMLAIVYYVLRNETPVGETEAESEYGHRIMKEAIFYLNQHKFFSLVEKRKLSQQAHTKQEYEAISTVFDQKNVSLVNDILKMVKVLSDINIEKANECLSTFLDNLKWDSGFMMRLISIPFSQMEDISFTVKKEIMKKIENEVEEAKKLPDEQRKVENYD